MGSLVAFDVSVLLIHIMFILDAHISAMARGKKQRHCDRIGATVTGFRDLWVTLTHLGSLKTQCLSLFRPVMFSLLQET